MNISCRRSFLAVLSLFALASCLPAFAGPTWTDPTPEELKMTSDPKAPDAPAVYLFREETVDDKMHIHQLYARIKILNEKGKETYSDIEIPYEPGMSAIKDISGRTIHADGTVVPFTGKPYDKVLVKSGNLKVNEKVFSMPDVAVGSIVEYRYELAYNDNYYIPPSWYIQQPIYVHKAHYHFVPVDLSVRTIVATDAFGKENPVNRMIYFPLLPPGTEVKYGLNGYDLEVDDVAALTDEEYEPPLDSFSYRLLFYYSPALTGLEFWKEEGKTWSKEVDRFANPSDKIRQAVAQIVAPTDTDEQKLQKIYAAVMQLENTRFTREHSSEENRAEGLRVKTAADIWDQKRGSDDEITRLFIAMARAAGMKASAMIVTERNRNLLNRGYLDWTQLEDEIAIVSLGGKDQFFDPGQRYCEFGKLHWMHTEILGIRQTDHGPDFAITPSPNYPDNVIQRNADLELSADGQLKGIARITMSGAEALRWRQEVLRLDEQEAKKQFEDELQGRVPPGVHVKMDHFLALTDNTSALMAVVDVSGNMGTMTGKRVFLPGSFFEAGARPLFSAEKRESPIDLHFPYLAHDHINLTLAPGLSVDSVPANADVPWLPNAQYKAKYDHTANIYQQERVVAVGVTLYKTDSYPQLRDFFQKIGAQDQQPVILARTPTTASQ
ncbi:MAG: DUF3857 and transglutaminase domain-containing protein [Acidobacteriaceae bacterium]